MDFYLDLPFYVELAILVAFSIALTFGLMALINRLVPFEMRESNNDLTVFIFSSVGLFSALIISTVLVMAIGHFNAANNAVENEADALGDLNRAGRFISLEFSKQLNLHIADYLNVVKTLEWDEDNHAANVLLEREAVNQLSYFVAQYEPKTGREINYHREVLKRLMPLYDARRARAYQVAPVIPSQLLVLSLIVALFTLVFALLFGSKNKGMHLLLTSILAVAMATTYSLILVFDAPFNGDLAASNQPYLEQLEGVERSKKFFLKQ